jgi:hypothetical protein
MGDSSLSVAGRILSALVDKLNKGNINVWFIFKVIQFTSASYNVFHNGGVCMILS